MAVAGRGLDSLVQGAPGLLRTPEFGERLREPPVRIPLVVVHAEVQLELLHGLLVQPLLHRLVGQPKTGDGVVGALRDEGAEGLESRAHRASHFSRMVPMVSGASSGVKCRTSGITSSVDFGIASCSFLPIEGGRNGSCAPQTIAVGATMSLSRGWSARVSSGSSASRCFTSTSRPSG